MMQADEYRPLLEQLLDNMPEDWRGTTFNNSELLGREGFSDGLLALLAQKHASVSPLDQAELVALGNAEDYLRVATNISTTLECMLATQKGWGVEQVWSFASATMPFLAVALSAGGRDVRLYTGDQPAPLTPAQCDVLALLGASLHCHAGPSPPAATVSATAVVLALEGVEGAEAADGIVGDSVLYIVDTARIDPEEILVVRKRMATPMTTPQCEAQLERLAGLVPSADDARAEPAEIAEFYTHLQQLCGTAPSTDTLPALFTAGLSALMSLWLALVARGGVDVLMCSTAYGGCSQCTDLVAERTERFRKSTFDIQGDAAIDESISASLSELAATASPLPLTVLFVEIPTNPDQKVPDTQKLIDSLEAYKAQTQKDILLVVDTTFAPGSQILAQIERLAPELPAMVFMSMSKSVSRGKTTAGTIVANHTLAAADVLRSVEEAGGILDTGARADQVLALVKNHWSVLGLFFVFFMGELQMRTSLYAFRRLILF